MKKFISISDNGPRNTPFSLVSGETVIYSYETRREAELSLDKVVEAANLSERNRGSDITWSESL